MSQDPQTYRRAAQAALIGFMVQLALGAVTAILGLYAGSPALGATAWYLAGGLPVWGILWVLYHQHCLERQEAIESQQLAGSDAQTIALFGEHAQDLQVAHHRLEQLYRWGLGVVSLIHGIFLLVVGGALLVGRYEAYLAGTLVTDAIADGVSTTVLTIVTAAVAFTAFVVARYESGMTRNTDWQLLRGGAGYLMGSCCCVVLVWLGALFAHYQNIVVLGWLSLLIPCGMGLVGFEVLVSLVLGAYRPRRPGEAVRPAFDSRVVGWMTSPGSIAQAINEAVNYQFGFEVSGSWFYQLLGRAVVPLVIFGSLTLVLASGLVAVEPHQQVIVTRLGQIRGQPLGPGLHLKFPWPVDRAQKYDIGRVHQVLVGSVDEPIDSTKAILWTGGHTEDEAYLMAAPTPMVVRTGDTVDDDGYGASGISLVGAQVAVQYRIANLLAYVKTAADGHRMLTAIAQRRTNAYTLTKDIDTLLGPGRGEAGEELRRWIQADADTLQLGLEVLFAGFVSVHPPSEQGVAAAFLEQIGALQERQSLIERAQQEAIQTLTAVAGSADKAWRINRAIIDLEQQSPHLPEQEVKMEQLLTTARGQAAQVIYEARARRWQRSVSERAAAQRFDAELMAYKNAPNYFRTRRYLDALRQGLSGARKYILAVGADPLPVFRIDLKDARSTIDAILQDRE